MIRQKRYEALLQVLADRPAVSIEEISARLDVSRATVRRDLMYLEQNGQLRRTRGGAEPMVKPAIEEVPIAIRNALYRREKERIAAVAVEFIRNGCTIYIGAGSTARELACRLGVFSKLTVVTNDIGVAYEISQQPENDLIVTGGALRKGSASLTGGFSEDMLRSFYVDTAFMSADAVKVGAGFMDNNVDEVALKRSMLRNAKRRVMLVDRSKFQQEAFMSICPLSGVDLAITDGSLDMDLEHALLEDGLILRVAPEEA